MVFTHHALALATAWRSRVEYPHPEVGYYLKERTLLSVQSPGDFQGLGKIGPMVTRSKERILSEELPTKPSDTEAKGTSGQAELDTCPQCGSERIKRIARVGLLNKYIYPMFGRYPWKCVRCGFTSMLKKRTSSRRHRRRSQDVEESGAATPPLGTISSQ